MYFNGLFCMPADRLSDEERAYAAVFCSFPWIGSKAANDLLLYFGSYRRAMEAEEDLLSSVLSPSLAHAFLNYRKEIHPEPVLRQMEQSKMRLILPSDPEYPHKLRTIPDPPHGLFVIGKLPEPGTVSVAVIGARDCTEYGRRVATGIGEVLGHKKVNLISGMARGIDGISQGAALAAGGYSLGILGSGPDVCYPKSNRFLYDSLKKSGGILSTHGPGSPARPEFFPPRNRIVSGMADAVIVVEARQKSGTLITVDMALEQGREVYIVPGRITDRLSDGCNSLLGQGARVFLSPEIFLQELEDALSLQADRAPAPVLSEKSIALHRSYHRRETAAPDLDPDALRVYELLEDTPHTAEELCRRLPADYTVSQVNLLLVQLMLDNLAHQVSQGSFTKR